MSGVKAWAVDTGIRAVKTSAQSAVALLGANTAGITDVSWVSVLNIAGLAGAVSILQNVANLNTKWYYEGGSVQPDQSEPA